MKTLAFDTCLDKMYVTVADSDKILNNEVIETTKEHYHSAFLISTITNILKASSMKPNDIDVIAINIGPGSFTGIRACNTVARVLAQGIGREKEIKTVGVSSLEILSRLNETEKPTMVVLDARKEMAYVAVYENKKEVFSPKAVLLDDVKDMISSGDYFIITDDKLEAVLGGESYQKTEKDLGKFLINIAQEKINSEFETDWRKLHPLYIQPPPVTIKKINN